MHYVFCSGSIQLENRTKFQIPNNTTYKNFGNLLATNLPLREAVLAKRHDLLNFYTLQVSYVREVVLGVVFRLFRPTWTFRMTLMVEK